jgi:hypothetical protein
MTARLTALRTAAVSLVSMAACAVALAAPLAKPTTKIVSASEFDAILADALSMPTSAGNAVSPHVVIEYAMTHRPFSIVP